MFFGKRSVALILLVVIFGGCKSHLRPHPRSGSNHCKIQAGRWGFINRRGQVVIQPSIESTMYSFHEGLLCASSGDKWGYIDTSGHWAIKPRFDNVGCFSEGVADVVLKGRCIYVDRTGRKVIDAADAVECQPFSNGYGMVAFARDEKGDSEYNFYDRRGHLLLKSDYDVANQFGSGLATVKSNGIWAIIDTKGRVRARLRRNIDVVMPFSEGLAKATSGGKCGFIDASGRWVIRPRFDDAESFSGGFGLVRLGDLYGFMNKRGRWLVCPRFHDADSFSEGLAAVGWPSRMGYIDKSGRFAIKPEFDDAYAFSEGLALVSCNDFAESVYIDKSGKTVISSVQWPGHDASEMSFMASDHQFSCGRASFFYLGQPAKAMDIKLSRAEN